MENSKFLGIFSYFWTCNVDYFKTWNTSLCILFLNLTASSCMVYWEC